MSDTPINDAIILAHHDPGHWTWDTDPSSDYNSDEYAPWLLDGNGDPVLKGSAIRCDKQTSKLIAAAPKMLAALKRILPYCMSQEIDPEPTPLYEHYHASKAVREAIANAEGKAQ
jgi:hypothetical protein